MQELWATDTNVVQEFMFSYLKDPLREVEQPYFHQEEVRLSHLPGFLLTFCKFHFFSGCCGGLLAGLLIYWKVCVCVCERGLRWHPPTESQAWH